jgi:sugar transferase EpsL
MKRLFDIVIILLFLLFIFLFCFVIAIFVRIKLGSPVLFKQPRSGLNGNTFKMIKFRTMTNALDKNQVQKSDSDRLTRFGKFLRSTSLDELPGLWNVLKGDMSLVGPRPLLVEYLPLYSSRQLRRHEVKPGITGWSQVNGRNTISWEEKFELDIWYVDNKSIWLDVKIILLTLKKVILRDGINQNNQVTMEKFKGSL